MLSFKLLSFVFSLKETLTLLKQYTAKRKLRSENIITETVKRTCRNFNSFNFHQFSIFMNDHWISSGLSRPKKIHSTTNRFPVIASLYIYKLKMNAKLQEKSLARWDISINHVPTVSCVNLEAKVLFLMFWSVAMVYLK